MRKILVVSFLVVGKFCFGQDFEITSYTFDKKINKKEFLFLFNKSDFIETYGLIITDKNKKSFYHYGLFAGTVTITKVNDSTFILIGNTQFRYGDIHPSFEVGKHI